MAIVYTAQLSPTKPELITAWLRAQPWCTDQDGEIELLGAFRFDDPDGEVGIEIHLVRGGSDTVYQVTLTYRGAPLAGAEDYLITEMDHSVLGERWVYDAVGDPVAIGQLLAAITTGGTQAPVFVDGATTPAPVKIAVQGTGQATDAPAAEVTAVATTGTDTEITTTAGRLVVHRIVTGLREAEARLDVVAGVKEAPATLASLH